jgi:hypothetical protein
MQRTLFLGIWAVMMLFALQARAQDLQTVYYQGVLVDPEGQPMPDGLYTITFAFYDSSADGKELWHEKQELYVEKGEFIAELGKITPLTLKFDKSSWLAVSLDEDDGTTERTEFLIPNESLDAE